MAISAMADRYQSFESTTSGNEIRNFHVPQVQFDAVEHRLGRSGFLWKASSSAALLRRVETHLSLVRVHELEESYRQAVFMLGEAGHYNDTDTGAHIWRMAAYACALATACPAHASSRADLQFTRIP